MRPIDRPNPAPLFALVVLVALCGCAHPTAGEAARGANARPGVAPTVSDREIRQRLEREGAELLASGATVPMSTLRAQLTRTHCALRLPAPTRRRLSTIEAAARMRQSVAIVASLYKCSRCTQWHARAASGFFLSEDGAVATCHHVASQADSEAMVVMDARGRILPVREVLAADAHADVAILRVEGQGFSPLPLSAEAPVGSTAHVLSHPDNQFYEFTTGVVSRHFSQTRPDGVLPMLAVTADFGKGSSGAPVCNDRGAVIGLVNNTRSLYYTEEEGKKDNLQMVFKNCTPASALLPLLRAPADRP